MVAGHAHSVVLAQELDALHRVGPVAYQVPQRPELIDRASLLRVVKNAPKRFDVAVDVGYDYGAQISLALR